MTNVPVRIVHLAPPSSGGAWLVALALAATATSPLAAPHDPVTAAQRSTAHQVADAGVPLSELSPQAPDHHTVRKGDTLWDIASLFLRHPWRWPELWGMNLEHIRNPHLIYPGQRLVLVKSGGRARLEFDGGNRVLQDGRLGPRIRVEAVGTDPITTVPMHLIRPFLTEAVILEDDEYARAPRIVAGREGRQLLGRGDLAYVRGDVDPSVGQWRVFRHPRPLKDPVTQEVLGHEAAYVGTAEHTRPGSEHLDVQGQTEIVPATFVLTSLRQEAGAGDRLAAALIEDDPALVPHAPRQTIDTRVISIYGDGLTAGAHQIVAIGQGRLHGLEAGHVLAVRHGGERLVDREDKARLRLPDEDNGLLFVFRTFNRLSYALVLKAAGPVRAGDHVTQP